MIVKINRYLIMLASRVMYKQCTTMHIRSKIHNAPKYKMHIRTKIQNVQTHKYKPTLKILLQINLDFKKGLSIRHNKYRHSIICLNDRLICRTDGATLLVQIFNQSESRTQINIIFSTFIDRFLLDS